MQIDSAAATASVASESVIVAVSADDLPSRVPTKHYMIKRLILSKGPSLACFVGHIHILSKI